MRLIKMTDFVLEQDDDDLTEQKIESIFNYANFLKQPLKLEMFVPCVDNELIIERHYQYFDNEKEHENYIKEIEEAKEKVLFEGFKVKISLREINALIDLTSTIEDLTRFDLTLTESAIKKLRL
jgi:hypothetical protein